MPTSRFEQIRFANEEVAHYKGCGDARGPSWLDAHPADKEKAAASRPVILSDAAPLSDLGGEILAPDIHEDQVGRVSGFLTKIVAPVARVIGHHGPVAE